VKSRKKGALSSLETKKKKEKYGVTGASSLHHGVLGKRKEEPRKKPVWGKDRASRGGGKTGVSDCKPNRPGGGGLMARNHRKREIETGERKA